MAGAWSNVRGPSQGYEVGVDACAAGGVGARGGGGARAGVVDSTGRDRASDAESGAAAGTPGRAAYCAIKRSPRAAATAGATTPQARRRRIDGERASAAR